MRKTLVILLSIVAFATTSVSFADEALFDTSSADQGVITVSYPAADAKVKVMVQMDDEKVFYNLDNNQVTVPLTFGNGDYQIAVLENISGTQYKIVDETTANVKMASPVVPFLTNTQTVNWENTNMMKAIVSSIVDENMSDQEKVQAVYNYVVDNFSYDYDKISTLDSTYVPNIDDFLMDGSGICYDYSALFAGMLRSQGIPVKLVKGYRSGIDVYHAWNEVYVDGEWIIVDTTTDSILKASGMFTMLEQDSRLYTSVHTY